MTKKKKKKKITLTKLPTPAPPWKSNGASPNGPLQKSYRSFKKVVFFSPSACHLKNLSIFMKLFNFYSSEKNKNNDYKNKTEPSSLIFFSFETKSEFMIILHLRLHALTQKNPYQLLSQGTFAPQRHNQTIPILESTVCVEGTTNKYTTPHPIPPTHS